MWKGSPAQRSLPDRGRVSPHSLQSSTCRGRMKSISQMRGRTGQGHAARRPWHQGGSQDTETLSQHQTPAICSSAGKKACHTGRAAVLGSSPVLSHPPEVPRDTGPISPNVQTRKPRHREAQVHRFQEGAEPHRPPWRGRLCSRGPEPSSWTDSSQRKPLPSPPRLCVPKRDTHPLCVCSLASRWEQDSPLPRFGVYKDLMRHRKALRECLAPQQTLHKR